MVIGTLVTDELDVTFGTSMNFWNFWEGGLDIPPIPLRYTLYKVNSPPTKDQYTDFELSVVYDSNFEAIKQIFVVEKMTKLLFTVIYTALRRISAKSQTAGQHDVLASWQLTRRRW